MRRLIALRKEAEEIATSLMSGAKTMADNETENERRNGNEVRYLETLYLSCLPVAKTT